MLSEQLCKVQKYRVFLEKKIVKQSKRLKIYIHIPFCVRKCSYCDFLSMSVDEEIQRDYVRALVREIELSREKMEDYLIDTVFIGGGTPSILQESLIKEILSALMANSKVSDDAEITIECNPGTVTEEKLQLYKKLGINRFSIGLQSANDKELEEIGRIHNYAQFLESYHVARKCGFDNINIDLMSALPGQSEKSYQETLKKIIELNPEHISAYSLIVEEGTEMYRRVESAEAKGKTILPKEKEERKMYYLTRELLAKAGYERYEISNYAKRGYECKHNIGYWKRKDYLGFGIGAASLYQEERYNNVRDIRVYMDKLLKADIPNRNLGNNEYAVRLNQNIIKSIEENQQKLSVEEQIEEFMFLGLRMMEGVSVKGFEETFGKKYEEVYGKVSDKLMVQGLLEQSGDNVRLTEWGIDVSNYVMAEFMF